MTLRDSPHVAPGRQPGVGGPGAARKLMNPPIIEVDDPRWIAGHHGRTVHQADGDSTMPMPLQAENGARPDRLDSPCPSVNPLDEAEDRLEDAGCHGAGGAGHGAMLVRSGARSRVEDSAPGRYSGGLTTMSSTTSRSRTNITVPPRWAREASATSSAGGPPAPGGGADEVIWMIRSTTERCTKNENR